MNERIQKIADFVPEKMFFDPSFEQSGRSGLLSDVKLGGDKSIFTRDQEYQIFRKYNYLKYRFMKLTVGFKKADASPSPRPRPPIRLNRIKEKAVCELEKLMQTITGTRNTILQANMRLVFRPVGRYAPTDSFERDEFVSNAHVHMMKAIECFDYRRGFKFSTYCVNVLKMNLSRDMEKLRKVQAALEFSDSLSKVARCDYDRLPSENEEYNAEMVRKVFGKISMSVRNPEEKIEILKGYYGIGGAPMLLREIGAKMNLSHERIRQIKSKTLETARSLAYDP
jgi:RNA polymerase sigma factor (sigma-70 family)